MKLKGKIEETELVPAFQREGDFKAVFRVRTDNGVVECKHKLYEERDGDLDRAKKVFAHLDLPWPQGISKLDQTLGRAVEVYRGEYQGKSYFRINVPRSSGGSGSVEDDVNALIDKLAMEEKVENEDVPF